MPRRRLTPAAFAERHGRPQDPYDEGYEAGYHQGWADGYESRGAGKVVETFAGRRRQTSPRGKRRKTAYQSAYSAAYKRLKKKHPRMSFGSLSKKAHAAARKKRK